MSRLQEEYTNVIKPALQKELGLTNPMAVPKIEKITINMGLGSALGDKKVLQSALEEMGLIAGQKPLTCNARKSVAS
ncbi:MAG: 50S ribosomal protein L5, partial [Candidatus Thioglobus sp.]